MGQLFWNNFSLFRSKVVFISKHVNLISFALALWKGEDKNVVLCLIFLKSYD